MYKYFLTYRQDGLKWLDIVKADKASEARQILRDRHGEITDIDIVQPDKISIDELISDTNKGSNTADIKG